MENKPLPRFINPCYHDEIRKDYTGLVQRIRTAIDDKGLAVLENFIDPGFLAQMRDGVDELTPLAYASGKRKPLIGSDLQDTIFWEVTFSEFSIQLANDILHPLKIRVEPDDVHSVLGILIGENGQDSVRGWHFDATYLTVAMPVTMPPPTGDRDGKFRIWPNVRPFSQSQLQNRFYSNLARIALFRRMTRSFAINFIPGNLYFFYGFRSYHGTEDLDPRQLRANCLINFGGPFFDLQKGKVVQYAK